MIASLQNIVVCTPSERAVHLSLRRAHADTDLSSLNQNAFPEHIGNGHAAGSNLTHTSTLFDGLVEVALVALIADLVEAGNRCTALTAGPSDLKMLG